MWNGGSKPPVTKDVVIEQNKNLITLSCQTQGSSIGYKISNDQETESKSWNVYTKPFPIAKGQTLKVIAQRIGYEPSGETSKKF
jgi:hypothetical protein